MEYVVGALLGVGIPVFCRLVGFDRDRALYPVMLIVIASYYGLFAIMGGSVRALLMETAVFVLFVGAAVAGFKRTLWIVAVAIAGHGLFDLVHGFVIANPGVPAWWPGFCMSIDVTAGMCLMWLMMRSGTTGLHARRSGARGDGAASYRRRIRPHVDLELAAARAAEAVGDAAGGFRHLERAHVLGQASTIEHVRVHAHMLGWGLRQRDAREVLGQIARLIGAAALTAFKAVPQGNTGGANVSAFRPMPVPDDLQALIAAASEAR